MKASLRKRRRIQPVQRRYRAVQGITRGRADGFRLGWEHGHWYGQCESILKPLLAKQEQMQGVRPIHVLFVATGKGFPYSPIDNAISSTLRGLVAQLTITDAAQPVADIALRIRPDLVLVLDGLLFNVDQIDLIRQNGIRTAIWFTDDPYYTDITSGIALHYDDVFTLELTCVEFYRNRGCNRVYYLPLGAFPTEFRPRNPARTMRHEICFIGSAYLNRLVFFDEVTAYLATKDTHISGIWWERLRDFRLMESKIEVGRWMEPRETADMYNGAKITINMHRAHDDETFNSNSAGITAASPNPRTFEISACATLQLTDIRSDLASFYTPGVEIETYASPQEMVEKIKYYLTHEDERRAIALRGLARTMREHTYARRLDLMLSILYPI
ncbi:CgeB family protein [Paenibacillus baekrokdamisoli]|nr:glycosyltransferase [Paenibacillus baekrokdamisoli]